MTKKSDAKMKVAEFEKHAQAIGLKPIEVLFGRGSEVQWFVCLDRRENKEYGLIIFDSQGKALIVPQFDEEEAMNNHIHIARYDGGVTVNGTPVQRDSKLDLRAQE